MPKHVVLVDDHFFDPRSSRTHTTKETIFYTYLFTKNNKCSSLCFPMERTTKESTMTDIHADRIPIVSFL